ncbi:MAG TPA: RNA 2',3'-cyclic phosphodiesterase [Planctomycetaceae bacterium]|jgi:2'-5' RNA ligase|nr:RNA 2',3'-cyclic phosphodiesterase [Planctomycetaceae bacterium]
MPDTIRCFLAVKITAEPALRRVVRDLSEMGRALKAVELENLHVTLKFVASADLNLIPQITAIAATAASHQTQSHLTLTGLGVFPHAQRPSVVWTGCEGPGAKTLSALAKDLETALEPLGFEREDRPFVPHLTLARVKAKPPEALYELLARHAKTNFGTAAINEIELIRSELGSDGPRYAALGSFPLATPAS